MQQLSQDATRFCRGEVGNVEHAGEAAQGPRLQVVLSLFLSGGRRTITSSAELGMSRAVSIPVCVRLGNGETAQKGLATKDVSWFLLHIFQPAPEAPKWFLPQPGSPLILTKMAIR